MKFSNKKQNSGQFEAYVGNKVFDWVAYGNTKLAALKELERQFESEEKAILNQLKVMQASRTTIAFEKSKLKNPTVVFSEPLTKKKK